MRCDLCCNLYCSVGNRSTRYSMTNYGFIGGVGSGKTTAAAYLHEQYGYTEMSFATPIKTIATNMIRQISEQSSDYDPFAKYKLDINDFKNTPAGRQLLQIIGDGFGRELIGPPHIWIDQLFERMKKKRGPIVVDDVRYENEAYALLGKGFKLIRLVRDTMSMQEYYKQKYGDNVTVLDHVSETELADFPTDFTLEFGKKDELFAMLSQIVENN